MKVVQDTLGLTILNLNWHFRVFRMHQGLEIIDDDFLCCWRLSRLAWYVLPINPMFHIGTDDPTASHFSGGADNHSAAM